LESTDSLQQKPEEFNLPKEIFELQQILKEKGLPPIEVPSTLNDPLSRTDIGNAEKLLILHGRNLRYIFPWKQWLIYDGTRWKTDNTGEIMKCAKDVSRDYAKQAAYCLDSNQYKSLLKQAINTARNKTIRDLIDLARNELAIVPEQLDNNNMLLNLSNGTLDLKTAELREHNPIDYISKIVPIEFDEKALCPHWEKFLGEIMDGNENLISFLQLAVGYSLTGQTTEQCLFILHGSGANGKSVFLETIRNLLGDYAKVTPIDSLLIKNNDSIPNDVAALKGSRFVMATESDEGKRLAESKIKQLTGQDEIAARFMRGEFFTFKPEFKLWLATNHRPEIKGTDAGIWRRIRLIPFEVTIPPSQQDKNLTNKLKDELPGILNWAVSGCLAWQRDGLFIPKEVEEATLSYRAEMDHLSEFLNEKCGFDPMAKTYSFNIFETYCNWCQENQETPLTAKKFGLRLKELGCSQIRMNDKNGSKGWQGIFIQMGQTSQKILERVGA
jgi:putative DNA primase/helicase